MVLHWGLQRGEMMGFASSTRSVCLDTRYLTFKPNFLRPHFVQKNSFRSFACGEKKQRDPVRRGLFHWGERGMPEMTYKKPTCERLQPDPPAAACDSSSHYAHWQQPRVSILASIRAAVWPKHYEVKSHNSSPTQRTMKASLWDYVNLIIPFFSTSGTFNTRRWESRQPELCLKSLLFLTKRWTVRNALAAKSRGQRGTQYSTKLEETNTWMWRLVICLLGSTTKSCIHSFNLHH